MNKLENHMIIFLNDDGVSIQKDGQSASYFPGGEMHIFCGTDKSHVPGSVEIKDRRSDKNKPVEYQVKS